MTHEFETSFNPESEMRRKDVPCWYEISLGEKAEYLELKIHQDFIQDSRNQLGNNHLIEVLQKKFDLHKFEANLEEDIGFGKIFKNMGQSKNGMIIYQVDIPRIRTFTDESCSLCHGDTCQMCGRTGKKSVTNYEKLYPISASLTVLTNYLITLNKPTSASYPQLLTLSTFTDGRLGGGALSGNVSLRLHEFLKSQTQELLSANVLQAMKDVTKNLFGENSLEENSSELSFLKKPLDGTISIGCLGYNSCGVGADDSSRLDVINGFGYEFSSHNVDNIGQQITLIAGLASLHDAARKETSNQ